ncbi:MAG: hypothetical protein ACR2G4_10720 [Pyrinomonadaceae bacterium]
MNRKAKHLLLYVALLAFTHGVGRALSYSPAIGYRTFLYYLVALCPLLIVPFVFGLMIRSWRQFVIYLLVTVIVWQVSFVLDDWVVGRLSDPLWLKDKAGTWSGEILGRCIMPIILISIGALMGQLKRTPRLP